LTTYSAATARALHQGTHGARVAVRDARTAVTGGRVSAAATAAALGDMAEVVRELGRLVGALIDAADLAAEHPAAAPAVLVSATEDSHQACAELTRYLPQTAHRIDAAHTALSDLAGARKRHQARQD
jgi:hypothetical protein